MTITDKQIEAAPKAMALSVASDDDWDYCPTCQGSGRVNPLTAPKGSLCVAAMDCPDCDGKGQY